ncbi:tRNA intron endonuclease [Klebsormidium nitens]|uniref:tRNA-intron lyase n=1 Tax=Klebsormidium nitens TaxID=105231 RepID=A0A1Y1I2I8_KLENI|nr:tRNA intron endonuclease [Klebsormidium nitens]|eukprot:GAQ82956.1 tRNA intron endonuclease [Klebsormidium nitens]
MEDDEVASGSIPAPSIPVKWKNKKLARPSSGMAELVQEMQETLPVVGIFHCGFVWLEPSEDEVELLERGAFGKPLPHAEILRRQAYPEEVLRSIERRSFIAQLELEEAFFLAYAVGWLHIKDSQGVRIPATELWRLFQECRPTFLPLYTAYHHFRCSGWVVKNGVQFGADWVLYRGHPGEIHSEYCVIVAAEGLPPRLDTWVDLHSETRLCRQVVKGLIQVNLIQDRGTASADPTEHLASFSIEEIQIKRWQPERHREGPQE